MPHLPRRQMTQSFGQRFRTSVTRRPGRRPHNPPRPFPTFRQTSRVQRPPRRRKPHAPNVPPALPQQVKQGQLMRRIPAVHQFNPRRDDPIPIAAKCAGCCAPCPVNHFRPGPESPQRRSRSGVADYLQCQYAPGRFASTARPVPASRPAATAARPKAPSAATYRPYS